MTAIPRYVAGLHHWSEQTSTEELRPRNGALINRLKFRQEDEYESICNALLTGQLDALVTTENHRYQALSGEHERVKRLFGNPKEAEISYYKKTKIFPINQRAAQFNERCSHRTGRGLEPDPGG